MTLMEQMLNIQNYGDKGGLMNLESVRKEILSHHAERDKKKKEKEETMTLIEKMFWDMFKATGTAVMKQALDDLFDDFNKGKL